MKRALQIFALFIIVSISYADFTGLSDDVRANLSAIQKYPKASSILLACSESFTLNDDGSQTYEWHSYRYFRDEAARDAWGDPRINYAEGRQQVEVLVARTYTTDGRQIDCTPENAFNPVVPDEMDLAPDFSEYRQLVVTLLGLENGTVSELHYKVTTPKPLLPWLEGRVYFRDEIPVIDRELVVQIPSGATVTYQGDRGAPEPTVNGNKYVWQLGEQQGYLPEDLAGHRELLPSVSFSTAKNWEAVCNELTHRIESATTEKLTPPKSLTEALAGINTVDTRIDAIKSWVTERFHKKHFDHSEFALTLRSASQVLNTGYGNGFELAVLVKSLADAWGVRCDLIPRFAKDPVIPSLLEWADPVLAVHPDLGSVYLTDPLAPRSELSGELNNSTLWDLSTCKERDMPTRSGTPHFNVWLSLKEIDKDTVNGRGSLITTGAWGVVELVQEHGATEYLNTLITLPSFTCTNAQVRELSDRRVSIDFDFTIASLDTADDYKIFSLAALDFNSKVEGAPWGLTSREFAQEIPLVGEVNLHLEAAIPEKWQVSRKPSNSSETWDWSTGDVTCKVEDGRLYYSRKLNLVREWLAPTGWGEFRTWMIESGPRPNNCMVFEPIGSK